MAFTIGLFNTTSTASYAVEHEHISFTLVDDKSELTADAYVIQSCSAVHTESCLKAVRLHPNAFSKPLFVLGGSHDLADQCLPNSGDEWLEYLQNICTRKRSFILNGGDEALAKCLEYLWLDPHRSIHPSRALNKTGGYEYPLLNLWLETSDVSAPLWLAYRAEEFLFQPRKLINRTRSCQHCASVLLNYVDVCKQCYSLEIKTEKAIHCFTCGHIAKEIIFQRDNILSCPNCLTQLRHIGSDYDRPIENTRCKQCNTLSIDALVQAHCFKCAERNEVDDLTVQNYYSYQLGSNASALIKTGNIKETIPAQLRTPISKEHLAWLMQWLVESSTQAETLHQLVKITVSNYKDLQSSTSEYKMQSMVTAFYEHLDALVNTENSCCRVYNDLSLYVFPNSTKSKMDNFKQALSALAEQAINHPFELDVVVYDLGEKPGEGEMLNWLNSIIER